MIDCLAKSAGVKRVLSDNMAKIGEILFYLCILKETTFILIIVLEPV